MKEREIDNRITFNRNFCTSFVCAPNQLGYLKSGIPLATFHRKHMRFQVGEGESLRRGMGEGGLPEGTWEGEGR